MCQNKCKANQCNVHRSHEVPAVGEGVPATGAGVAAGDEGDEGVPAVGEGVAAGEGGVTGVPAVGERVPVGGDTAAGLGEAAPPEQDVLLCLNLQQSRGVLQPLVEVPVQQLPSPFQAIA